MVLKYGIKNIHIVNIEIYNNYKKRDKIIKHLKNLEDLIRDTVT